MRLFSEPTRRPKEEKEVHVTATEVKAAAPKRRLYEQVCRPKLEELLEQHQQWLSSGGWAGERADLSYADLEAADLAGVSLQGADLQKANLRGADLSLANLRDACLVGANLEAADLLGTELQGAQLQGAHLATATTLSVRQLAGANLAGAELPKAISQLFGVDQIARLFRSAGRLLLATILVSLATWGFVAATRDVQLIKNSPAFPVTRVGEALPIVPFYLIAPVLLLGLYLYLHFYCLRLWEGLAGLPAILPDGRRPDQSGPRIMGVLARDHFKQLGGHFPAPWLPETAVSTLLAYWLVPATLALFWARYLTRQDLRGTMVHALLIVAAVGIAVFWPSIVSGTLRTGRLQAFPPGKSPGRVRATCRWAALGGAGAILCFLSVGTIEGIPHDSSRAPEFKTADFRRWAADVFWAFGYIPHADLAETAISAKPKNWSGREEELSGVMGAHLNKANLRYAEGYRTFLANAHLWQADLQGAFLSESDLRGADLRQANLRSAVLDRALLGRANIQGANLQRTNLVRADLREVDLSYASLTDALLMDARLSGANLFQADLVRAALALANLEKADLRQANLAAANLKLADLREADLWSAKFPRAQLQEARLGRAICIEADLRGANLAGADLQGAILRGADLSGAVLKEANFRGVLGLTGAQVCSAADRHNVQLDEEVQRQVEALCGGSR